MDNKQCKKQNEPLSALSHFIGALLSIVALCLLVISAVLKSDAWHIVSFAIFGVTLVLLYLASAIFHSACKTSKKKCLYRRIDLSMIYILIAGSYTPICLVALRGGWGWGLFGVAWGIVLIGSLGQIFWHKKIPDWFLVANYILMGSLVFIAFFPLLNSLSKAGIFWLIAGGISYMIGLIFLAFSRKICFSTRWFSLHDVFHFFVLGGSFCHFWLMWKYILYL